MSNVLKPAAATSKDTPSSLPNCSTNCLGVVTCRMLGKGTCTCAAMPAPNTDLYVLSLLRALNAAAV